MTLMGLRVLIAEDETLIRLDLRQMLEEHGLVVCGEARDGVEAVELARELEPDLAVFDLKMPNLDGVEAARRVYAERPLPIVMLTAYSDRQTVDRAIGAGVFSYISKPFGPHDVIPAIRAAVARHADLLEARREVGKREEPIEVKLTSSSGHIWPLRVHRKPDGSVAVDVLPE
jgi:AmiR/NasT family two-component response regulator